MFGNNEKITTPEDLKECVTYEEWLTYIENNIKKYMDSKSYKSGKHKRIAREILHILDNKQNVNDDTSFYARHVALNIKDFLKNEDIHPRGWIFGWRKSELFKIKEKALIEFKKCEAKELGQLSQTQTELSTTEGLQSENLRLKQEAEKQKDDLWKKIKDLEEENKKIRADFKEVNTKLTNYEKENILTIKLRTEHKELNEEHEKLKKEHTELKTKHDANLKRLEEIERTNTELEHQRREIEEQRDKLQKDLQDAKETISQKQESLLQYSSEARKNEDGISFLRMNLTKFYKKLLNGPTELDAQSDVSQNEIPQVETQREVKAKSSEIIELKKENLALRQENEKMKRLIEFFKRSFLELFSKEITVNNQDINWTKVNEKEVTKQTNPQPNLQESWTSHVFNFFKNRHNPTILPQDQDYPLAQCNLGGETKQKDKLVPLNPQGSA